MIHLSRCLAFLIFCGAAIPITQAQTATLISADESAAHSNEWAIVACSYYIYCNFY
jgi:hypothetical protein